MRVAVLHPVLIGNRLCCPGEEIDLSKTRAERMARGPRPAVRLLDSEDLPRIVRQSPPAPPLQQPAPPPRGPFSPQEPPAQTAGANDNSLTLEQMVVLGIPPKIARILIDAGVTSTDQLTEDQLIQIEGVGEKTIELILACVHKDAA